MTTHNDFKTLLLDLAKTVNNEVLTISRKVNGIWEVISLSNYKNSADLILVEGKEFAFTVSRWDANFTIGQQITEQTNDLSPLISDYFEFG